MKDSVSVHIPVKDTLFVPLYIRKDTSFSGNTDSTVNFRDYVTDILNDSFPVMEYRPSLFVEKTCACDKQMKLQPISRSQDNHDWAFIVLLFVLSVMAVVMKLFSYRYFEILRSCFSNKFFEIFLKYNNSFVLYITLLALPVISLLLYAFASYFELDGNFGYDLKGYELYAIAFAVVSSYIAIKILLIKFLGSLFRNKEITRCYITNQLSFLCLDSLILYLPTALALFVNDYMRYYFVIAASSIFVLLSVIRAVRGLYLIINLFKFSSVYLFCYLCIVEFLPLFILVKVLFM